jgi:hypothetical protein
VAAPLRGDDGRTAPRVFELPQWGRQWIATSAFASEGRDLWRLYWQPLVSPAILDAHAGLDRSRWQRGFEWLDEARMFLGPSLRWLAGGGGEHASDLGSNRSEMAVVTFVAPEAGEYLVEFGAKNIGGYSQQEKELGLNLVHFAKDAVAGKSLAFFSSSRAAMQSFTRQARTKLEAGDEVALVLLPFNVGAGAYFGGVTMRCGRLE